VVFTGGQVAHYLRIDQAEPCYSESLLPDGCSVLGGSPVPFLGVVSVVKMLFISPVPPGFQGDCRREKFSH
jgi:hypothetical protein